MSWVRLLHAREELAESLEQGSVFLRQGTADGEISGPSRRRAGSFVEDPIKGDLESVGPFLESVNRRDGVAVLDARDVEAEEAGALLNVPLGEVLGFPEPA
jgi:hypothetical protein